MKQLFLGFLLLFTLTAGKANAQKINPAKWSWTLSKPNPAVGETVDVIFTITTDKTWHHFASDFDPNVGPIVTTIKFKPSDSFELVGNLKSINPIKKHDEIFDGDVSYFEGKGELRQTIKILKENPVIEGNHDGQACSDATGQCVPVKGKFKLEVKKGSDANDLKKKEDSLAKVAALNASSIDSSTTEQVTTTTADSSTTSDTTTTTAGVTPEGNTTDSTPEATSLWSFFLLALGGGFVSLLTPCVYPLIPMTVSYFTKQKGGLAKAIIYGLSIIAIYVLFGTVIAYTLGQAAPNFISTHWIPNLLFFGIFVFFGLSFLGWFEIVLPSEFVNKIDAQSDRGGLGGVFFMAFTLVLVSFSCTGPIAGSILSLGSQGQVLRPIVGMLGFGVAFAIPFTLFAMFPNMLKTLPKSGAWMNSVKVILGFLELALALKFLSTADQTYHWHLLDREIYLGIWIVIFTMIGLYLIGKIQMPHDSKLEKIPVPRMLMAIAVFSFVVYMIPGMFGAPLKALSGWLPPIESQDFVIGNEKTAKQESTSIDPNFPKSVKYGNFLKLPNGLQGFFDYKEAVAYAKSVNKPLFIDFTGHGCVNCRKMEATVWSNPEVKKRLENDYVMVALYVDDKTELPKSEWFISKDDGLEKTSIGDQNLDFEITKFNGNAQPYYCLVNPNSDAKTLVKPRAYNENIEEFVQFLEDGKAKFAAGK
ncbi:MAG: cytochrome c biogenesis protein CcdA [Flectobacillus sp.]|nr:cytochrome c biogenesis protein CcdA [Flectobacillus sp.]